MSDGLKPTVDIKTFGRLAKAYAIFLGEDTTTMPKIFSAWNRIYGTFIRKRFVAFSRGGGDWPALALSTIAGRRKGRSKSASGKKQSSLARDTKQGGKLVSAGGNFAILRDSGLLFAQLAPGIERLGKIEARPLKVVATVSFGGKGKYKDGNGVSTSDVMSFHQEGGGRLPRRKILVDADDKTKQTMARAGDRILKEELNK